MLNLLLIWKGISVLCLPFRKLKLINILYALKRLLKLPVDVCKVFLQSVLIRKA